MTPDARDRLGRKPGVARHVDPSQLDHAVLRRLVAGRHSCRAFDPEPLSRDLIQQILHVAQRAPSWCNTQPWEVHVTDQPATRRFSTELLAHLRRPDTVARPDYVMPNSYTGVLQERRRRSGWQLYEAVGVAPGDRAASAAQAMRNFELFGAPHLAIVTVDGSLGTYGVLDAGVYLASFLLAAESLGVATIAQAALATYADFVKNFFDVPSDRKVLVGVSFGRPDTGHPANSFRTERAAVADIVHWSAE